MRRSGFTLVELLVVMLIIMLVSAVALPTVLSSWRERQAVSAASLLQASIEQAKTEAQSTGVPHGLRFLPDPTTGVIRLPSGQVDPAAPLACNRWVAIASPGTYSEGAVSIFAGFAYSPALTGGLPCLVLEQQLGHWVASGAGWQWVLDAPTSWAWNIRVGEKLSLGAGAEYTVCGPMTILPGDGNPEAFVNWGASGTAPPTLRTYLAPDGVTSIQLQPEYLMLVNGQDDNADGWPDSGWDGVDNDGDGLTDELDEWEAETWQAGQARGVDGVPYTIRRRPVASSSKPVVMPGSMVLDATTWGWAAPERSRVRPNLWTGDVDIVFGPGGEVVFDTPYGVRSGVRMQDAFVHLWLGDKSDVPDAPLPAPPVAPATWSLPAAKEDARLVSIGKSGRVIVSEVNPDDPAPAYLRAQRGR
ncbi:MAG: prepilin-type N-terminal cleavage/methylation domain-containing protein [Isosphaeraceae bacterium]